MKILFITSAKVDEKLGIGKVIIGMSRELANIGIDIYFFDQNMAFPFGRTRMERLLGPTFAEKASEYVATHGFFFDIIDYGIGDLFGEKNTFKLSENTLLITRSHGLEPLHKIIKKNLLSKIKLESPFRLKTYIGNIIRKLEKKDPKSAFSSSLNLADFVIMTNTEEKLFLEKRGFENNKIKVIYHGFFQIYDKLNEKVERYISNEIVYIGRWSKYKGSHDLVSIIQNLSSCYPWLRFKILGIGKGRALQLANSHLKNFDVSIIPEFSPEELPHLLANAKLGIFPSYVEGFPSAVLEQLLFGIPVVCYDIPGVREMLDPKLHMLMSPVSNWLQMEQTTKNIIDMDENNYFQLSSNCHSSALKFTWEKATKEYINLIKNMTD